MSDDALGMFHAMRPQAVAASNDIRPGQGSDLHSLAMVPGTPGYNARIPRPPCYRCGEDHVPGLAYDHEWNGEPPPVHDEPVSATAVRRSPAQVFDVSLPPVQPEPPNQRVALYVGRGDTYVIAVERAPDWDAVTTLKVEPEMVVPMMSLVRALDIKISDKTGGDLMMLQQEAQSGRREPSQADGRNAPTDGDRGPRQRQDGADGSEVDQPQAG